MKRFLITLAGLLVVCGSTAVAQQKFGYVNSQELLFQMPEIDSVQVKLNKLNEDYTEILETMQVELNTKLQDYQKNSTTYTPAIRQNKERELQELQVRLEEFYGQANQEIAEARDSLFAPVIEKAQNAIQKVGRENGFFAVFDRSIGAVVYLNEGDPNMVDITPMVKRELGIQN